LKINRFLETIKGLSPNTVSAYRQTLWLLWTYMRKQNGSLPKSAEPTEENIRGFLQQYKAISSTLHRHKAAVKAYWEYLHPKEVWPINRREFMSPRRRVPRYTSPDNIPLLLEQTDNEDDAMFVETLFQLGCRISELLGIEEKDITPAGVLVVTKGGHQRLKITTSDFNKKLKSYAQNHKKGKVFPKKYSYYIKRLKLIGHRAGIDDISPHMLRHARAVDLLNKGMGLAFVQQFLGHANINTTAIYLEITGGELAQNLERVEAAALNGGK
jgi:integrase/recombinase XerD